MARTKTVFPTEEIPHLWAHQTQDEARNAQGNLYFDGPTIYSYGSHFPIAKHIKRKSKGAAIQFTTRSHSVTTSKHISLVSQAIPAGVPVFHVGDVRRESFDPDAWKDYQDTIAVLIGRGKRARVNGADLLGSAASKIAEANAYAEYYGQRKRFPAIEGFDKLVEKAQAAEARASKAARKAAILREVTDCNREAAILRRWLAGEEISYSLYNSRFFFVKLRVKGDQIETSQGARVPLEHGPRVYRFVKAVVAKGEEWQSNGHKLPIGPYHANRIDADGTLYAGCHVIRWDEIQRLAISQGW